MGAGMGVPCPGVMGGMFWLQIGQNAREEALMDYPRCASRIRVCVVCDSVSPGSGSCYPIFPLWSRHSSSVPWDSLPWGHHGGSPSQIPSQGQQLSTA